MNWHYTTKDLLDDGFELKEHLSSLLDVYKKGNLRSLIYTPSDMVIYVIEENEEPADDKTKSLYFENFAKKGE